MQNLLFPDSVCIDSINSAQMSHFANDDGSILTAARVAGFTTDSKKVTTCSAFLLAGSSWWIHRK